MPHTHLLWVYYTPDPGSGTWHIKTNRPELTDQREKETEAQITTMRDDWLDRDMALGITSLEKMAFPVGLWQTFYGSHSLSS